MVAALKLSINDHFHDGVVSCLSFATICSKSIIAKLEHEHNGYDLLLPISSLLNLSLCVLAFHGFRE
jgi:hypothetical protein